MKYLTIISAINKMNSLNCLNGTVHKSQTRKDRCNICITGCVSTNIKINCPKCTKSIKAKNIKFHSCDIEFVKYEEDAWLGDAKHRVLVIKYLKSLNYNRSNSNTHLDRFVQATAQVNYLIKYTDLITEESIKTYSEHKLSSIFEAKFLDREFKNKYKKHLYQNELW